MNRWPAYLVVLGLAFLGGRLSKRPEVRTETKTVIQEKIQWREKTVTAENRNESAAKQENVRVVTRWLRRDGTVAKEATAESQSKSQALAQSASSQTSQVDAAASRDSKSVTVSVPTYQPRLQVGGLLGLDLRNRAERRWGAYATYRVAGPVTIGGWWVPGMAGASLGVTF